MTIERQELLRTFARYLMSEACNALQAEGHNQMHFLSVDSKTNQTVVAVVAQGDAADLMLKYLDSTKNVPVGS